MSDIGMVDVEKVGMPFMFDLPTPVFLPGESQGWRSLVGYSPWGNKKLDTTEHTHIYLLCVEAGQFKDYINTAQIHFSVSQQVYTP